MVAKQALFLVLTLCALVYITFGTDVFDTSFTDEQYAALVTMTKLYLGSAIYCFVVSELAKNYSQVDKFWSLIPIAYVWYFANASRSIEEEKEISLGGLCGNLKVIVP